jgi:predicted dehydrogenase
LRAPQALVRGGSLGRPYFGLITRFGHRPNVRHSGSDDHAYLWERGIHDFDTALHCFDSPPKRVLVGLGRILALHYR